MNQETIEDFRQKHFENYKNAVLGTLKNNTISLFDDDILSLLVYNSINKKYNYCNITN